MKKIICLLLISTLIFTGCTLTYELDEDKVKGISDNIVLTLINSIGKEEATKNESHTIKSSDKNIFYLKSSVGDVSIVSHKSEDTIVDINITARASTKDEAEDLIENYTYTISSENNSILVDTSIKGALKNVSLITDMTIYIPSNINIIEVSTDVGDIHLQNLSGTISLKSHVGDILVDDSEASYDLKADVGDILVSRCVALGNSDFKTSTGDIELYFLDISEANNITAESSVGDIEMSIDATKGYKAIINEFMKDEKVKTKDSQHTKIDLSASVGEVNFK